MSAPQTGDLSSPAHHRNAGRWGRKESPAGRKADLADARGHRRVTNPDYRAGMPTAGSAEVMMMLLADARLPTGAHTQSAGLEPALRAGVPASSVPAYITARLRSVTTVEAAAAVLARARTG